MYDPVFEESYENLFLDFVRKNVLKLNIKNVGNNKDFVFDSHILLNGVIKKKQKLVLL